MVVWWEDMRKKLKIPWVYTRMLTWSWCSRKPMTYKTFCIKKHWRETRQQFSGTPLVWRLLGKKPSFRFTPRVKWLKTPSPLGLSQPCPQPTLQPVAALNFSCYCRMVADAISKYHWEKCRGEEAGVEDMIERKNSPALRVGWGIEEKLRTNSKAFPLRTWVTAK